MSGNEPRREGTGAAIAADRLAEIRRRAEASVEGPFGLSPRGFGDYDVERVDERGERTGEIAGIRGMFYRLEDAEFYMHAREDILELLNAPGDERRGRSG